MEENISQVINTLHRLTSGIFSDAIQRKLILDNLTSGVFTVDPDLKVTSFNKAAETITGISETEAIGKLCTELFTSPTSRMRSASCSSSLARSASARSIFPSSAARLSPDESPESLERVLVTHARKFGARARAQR